MGCIHVLDSRFAFTLCIHASPRRKMGFFNGHWIGGEERHNSPAAHLVAVSDSFVRCCPYGRRQGEFGVPKTSIQWIHSHWALVTPLTPF